MGIIRDTNVVTWKQLFMCGHVLTFKHSRKIFVSKKSDSESNQKSKSHNLLDLAYILEWFLSVISENQYQIQHAQKTEQNSLQIISQRAFEAAVYKLSTAVKSPDGLSFAAMAPPPNNDQSESSL
ncbi:hypothetical protein YC2023_119151 [Brassica napus]